MRLLIERAFLLRLLRRAAESFAVGVLFGGMATGWIPDYTWKGGLIGLIYVLPVEIGSRAFRSWTFKGSPAGDPRRAGTFFVLKLLLLWAAAMALILPLIHWGLGIPVLRNLRNATPHMAISLTWVAILLVAETATNLHRTGAALAASEARAAFLALKAQIQPHTLFNALNTIAALARTQPDRAEEGARRLATLLRGVLEGLEQERWSLAAEFALLSDLLRLESLRFGERLTWELDLPEELGAKSLPPLLVLPLVENSLKHGFRSKIGPCHLRVSARTAELSVSDDGVGRSPGSPDGVGLTTVRERAGALGWTLHWPEVPGGCRVVLRWR